MEQKDKNLFETLPIEMEVCRYKTRLRGLGRMR
jgi:hypothetical protein